jgi:hypothetical protein
LSVDLLGNLLDPQRIHGEWRWHQFKSLNLKENPERLTSRLGHSESSHVFPRYRPNLLIQYAGNFKLALQTLINGPSPGADCRPRYRPADDIQLLSDFLLIKRRPPALERAVQITNIRQYKRCVGSTVPAHCSMAVLHGLGNV